MKERVANVAQSGRQFSYRPNRRPNRISGKTLKLSYGAAAGDVRASVGQHLMDAYVVTALEGDCVFRTCTPKNGV